MRDVLALLRKASNQVLLCGNAACSLRRTLSRTLSTLVADPPTVSSEDWGSVLRDYCQLEQDSFKASRDMLPFRVFWRAVQIAHYSGGEDYPSVHEAAIGIADGLVSWVRGILRGGVRQGTSSDDFEAFLDRLRRWAKTSEAAEGCPEVKAARDAFVRERHRRDCGRELLDFCFHLNGSYADLEAALHGELARAFLEVAKLPEGGLKALLAEASNDSLFVARGVAGGDFGDELLWVSYGFVHCGGFKARLAKKPRAVLAALLRAEGEPVGAKFLLSTVWADNPIATCKNVQDAICTARKTIRALLEKARKKTIDPIQTLGDGDELAWVLTIPNRENRTGIERPPV
jgi:Transcriptional regulatory protein, C terminal